MKPCIALDSVVRSLNKILTTVLSLKKTNNVLISTDNYDARIYQMKAAENVWLLCNLTAIFVMRKDPGGSMSRDLRVKNNTQTHR